eukprot:2737913-Rhodomonas_salina.1
MVHHLSSLSPSARLDSLEPRCLGTAFLLPVVGPTHVSDVLFFKTQFCQEKETGLRTCGAKSAGRRWSGESLRACETSPGSTRRDVSAGQCD